MGNVAKHTEENVVPVEIETLMELDDLELGAESDVDETIEEAVEEDVLQELVLSEEDVSEEELRSLESHIEREEAYQEQESTIEADATAAKEKKATAKTSTKRAAKTSSTPSTPRVSRDFSSVPAEFFVLQGDVSAMDDAAKDAAKAETMTFMPTQKKIAEKFENLFQALSVGKQPSVYVVQAFKLLDSKGAMTSKELVASFSGTYSQGTSMSQAGQIMNLFDAVKIAKREKNVLTLNKDSVIAQRLREVIAAAKAA